jgi:hypothetical protein
MSEHRPTDEVILNALRKAGCARSTVDLLREIKGLDPRGVMTGRKYTSVLAGLRGALHQLKHRGKVSSYRWGNVVKWAVLASPATAGEVAPKAPEGANSPKGGAA